MDEQEQRAIKKREIKLKIIATNKKPVSIYLERVQRTLPFFTINGLHSFLISIHSILSRDSLWPSGQMHLYEPAVLMQFAIFGQRIFAIFSRSHSLMSIQCPSSFMR